MNELINFGGIVALLNAMAQLIQSIINLFATCFAWLGAPTISVLVIGAGIAIALRILGR